MWECNGFECLINVINNILAFLMCCMEYKFAIKRYKRLVTGAVPLKGQICTFFKGTLWYHSTIRYNLVSRGTYLPLKGTYCKGTDKYPCERVQRVYPWGYCPSDKPLYPWRYKFCTFFLTVHNNLKNSFLNLQLQGTIEKLLFLSKNLNKSTTHRGKHF